jgi:uncharacterized protein YkwD
VTARFPGAPAVAAALSLAALVASPCAKAGDRLLADLNALRVQGCGGRSGQPALRPNAALDGAAAALAAGAGMKDAMSRSGYRSTQAAMLEVTGPSDAAMAHALAKRGCRDLADPAYREVGLASREGAAWIVLAAPFDPPGVSDAAEVGSRVLALVNDARASRRRCGWKRFEAAPPLAASAALDRAALAHAKDMASRSALGHAGGDGSAPGERATRAGYRWRLVGENIAAGQPTAERVVAEWLDSPHHCANLMDPGFTDMGIGFAADAKSAKGIYWSQLFGAPAR